MMRFLLFLGLLPLALRAAEVSSADHPSIQAALDANPGVVVFVPAGDHKITEKVRLRAGHGGLRGPGRIVQHNPQQPILEIEDAVGLEVRDLTLTRPAAHAETDREAVLALRCRDLVLENVRVVDNHTRAGAITLRDCRDARISRCLVRNYMRVTVDDRTHSQEWGYAFNCTDGTGLSIQACTGTLIEGNRILEERLRPTPELKAQHKLGDWIKRNPVRGNFINEETWQRGYTDNWQQGSGLIVTSPTASDLTRILGNHIENAAQGIDLHSDHVIVAHNVIVNSFMGMKAMHGSRNVLITGNQFVKNSLWAIGLMPGAAANAENYDGGSIIADNLISDFGHGDAHWIWGSERSPFKFDTGQQADDPPLTDVLVSGNLIHNPGPPRYKVAVVLPEGPNAPRGMHFANNLFPPGTAGVANRELPE